MKIAVIWFMCMIVVAASALIIVDKVMDLVDPKSRVAPSAVPTNQTPRSASAADPALLERLDKVEKLLDSVRQMLDIPELEAPESRDPDNPGPPPQAGLGERLQWLEAELADLRRQQNRDLMQIFARLRRRLDEMEATLGKSAGPDSRARIEDLKKFGVAYDAEAKLISMEAAFAQPTRVLEFVAVGSGGNVHESLLVVNARPSALKRAIEMMDVAEAGDPPYDPAKLGKDTFVYVYVKWPGRATPIRIEKLLRNASTGKLMAPTPFVFTASRPFIDPRTWDERLSADINKMLIGLTWNYGSEAVITSPAPEAESEHVWTPEVDAIPEAGSPATLLVSREERPEWN
jgi:hypothetical protein